MIRWLKLTTVIWKHVIIFICCILHNINVKCSLKKDLWMFIVQYYHKFLLMLSRHSLKPYRLLFYELKNKFFSCVIGVYHLC